MHHVPLHRRLLPWMFFGIFLVLAPTLILYSSGYRYNAKKGFLEQLGTLIVDTTPINATILIDEQPTGQATPETFQSIHPGWHRVSVEKEGYSRWSKMLEISQKQVTFANAIRLWKESAPDRIQTTAPCRLFSDPSRTILLMAHDTSVSSTMQLMNADLSPIALSGLPGDTACSTEPFWRNDGKSVRLSQPSQPSYWWYNASPVFKALPDARYHWEGDTLMGYASTTVIQLTPRTGKLIESSEKNAPYSAYGDVRIEQASSSQRLVIDNVLLRSKTYELPSGTWDVAERQGKYLLLRNGEQWIAIDSSAKEPYVERLIGDRPRWLPESSVPTALFRHGNELWLWRLNEAPNLIWRQTEPIVQVEWHKEGRHIFIAFSNKVATLELDERDGRLMTTLEDFDQIKDMAILGTDLFISGTKDGKEGMWKLQVED